MIRSIHFAEPNLDISLLITSEPVRVQLKSLHTPSGLSIKIHRVVFRVKSLVARFNLTRDYSRFGRLPIRDSPGYSVFVIPDLFLGCGFTMEKA